MNMRIRYISVLLLSMLIPLSTQAKIGFYAGALVDYTNLETTETIQEKNQTSLINSNFKQQFSPALMLGYQFEQLHTELAVSFDKNKYKEFSVQDLPVGGSGSTWNLVLTTAMMNIFYDISLIESFKLTPYIGIGGGLANISIQNNKNNADNINTFAYQGLAGLNYKYSKQLNIILGYRYLKIKKADINIFDYTDEFGNTLAHTDQILLNGHIFDFGFRFNF